MVETMSEEIIVSNVSDLPGAAQKLISHDPSKKIFVFYGLMGAGKTTFIKEVCKALNVKDVVSSPTFSLVNEYHTTDNKKIFHFDFYRIKDESEAYDLGYEDYFYSGNYCLIEWPEKIESIVPEDCIIVNITQMENEKRKITIS
jgi:tRNA threonylcarbamoyladenosine biosynthesis protein TsaE